MSRPAVPPPVLVDPDMDQEVDRFLFVTGLRDSSDRSDEAFEAIVNGPQLAVSRSDNNLSLSHPKMSALLDDLDERLRRYVRYYRLADVEYSRREDREMKEQENEDSAERQITKRTRQMYGEAIIQGEEETERQIQDKKLSKQSLPPPSTALVLGILRVQALLLSHCAKPHLFNSTDRLLALLNSDDPTLLMASLYVLFQLQSTSSRQLTFQSFQARYVHGISPTTAMPHSSTIHVKNLLFTLANGVWGMREGSAEFNHASRSSKKPESTKPVVDDDEDMEEKKEEKKEDLKRQNSKKQKSSSSNKAKSQPLSTASEESPAKRRKGSKKKHLVDSPAAPATSNVFSSSSTTSSVNEEKLELHPLLTASPSLFPAREPVAPLPSLRSYVSPSSAPTQLSPTAKQIYALLSYKSPQQIQQDMQKFEREFGTAFVFPRIGGESNTNHAEHSAHGTGTSVSSSSPPPSVLTLSFLLQLYEKHAANFRSVCDFVLTLASPSLAAAANLPCYAIPPKHFFTLGFVLRYLLHYPSLDMRRKFLSIRLLSIQLLMTFSGQRKDVVEQIAHFDSLVIEGLVHIMRSDHVDILPPSLHNTTTNYPHLIQLIEGVSYPSSSAATAFLPSPSSTAYCLPHSLRAMSILTLQSLAASPSICRELQQTGILQHGVLLTLVKQSLANLTTFFSPPAGTTPPAVINPQQPLWWLSPTDLHFAACSVILTDCLFSFVQRLIPKAPYQSALLNHQEVLEIMVEVLRDRKVMQTTIFWRAAHIIEMCHHHSMSAITPRLQALQVADVLVDRLTDLISVRPFLSSVDGLTVESMDFNADTGNTSSSAAPTVSSSTPSAASDSTPPYSLPASSLFQVSPSYDFQPGVTVKALMPCVINSRKSVIIKMLYLLAGIIRHDREPVKLKSLKEGKLTALIKQLWLQSYDWKNTPKMFHANNLDSQSASSAAIPSNVTSSSSLSLSSPNSQARKRKGEEENPSTSATDAVVPVAASTSTDVAANSSKRQKLGSHSDDTHWGEQVYVTACQLVIGLAQNNPASVKQLYTDGLVRTFIDTLAYDVSGSLTAQCLPETLRTMCLHFESRDLILRNPARNPLKDLVLTVFLSQNPRHVIAVDVHMHVFAKSVEEFFRHYGRTTPTSQSTETATKDFMSFSHQLLELIRQQGKELERITALQSTDAAWVSAPVIGGIQLRPESFSQYSRRLLCFSKFLEIMLKNFGSNYLAAHGDKNLSAATQIQQQLRKFVLTMTNTAIERNLSPSLSGVFVGAKATEVIRNAAGELLNSNIATPSHSTPEAFSLKHVAFHNNSFISPIVILSNKPDYTPKIFAWLLERSVQVIKQCLSSPRQAGVATAKSALANSYLRFVDRDRKMEILSDDSLKPVLYRNTDFCGNLDLKVEFQQDELLAHELGELSAACWCSHLLSRLTRRLPISNFVTKQTPVEENDDASNTSPASPLSLSFADDLYLPLIEALRRVQAAIAHDQISTLQVSREMDAVNAQIKAEEKNALNTSSNDMCDVSSSIPPRKREFVFIRSNSSIATDLYHSALAKFNQYTWKLMGSLLKVAKTAENLGGSHTQVSKQSLEDSKKMYSFLATGIVNLLSIPDVPSPHRQGIPPTAFESSVWKLSPHLESHLFSLFYLKPVLKLVRILLYQSSNSVIHLATELNTSFLATIRQAGGGEKLLKMMRWAMMSRITLAKHMEAVANGSTDVNPTLAGSTVAHKEMLLAYDEILSEIGFFTEQLAKYDCETEKSDKQPSFAQSVSAAMASIMQQAHASQPSVTTTSAASPEAASSNNSTSVAASSSATTVTPASTSSTTSFPLSPSVYETAVSGASVIDDVKEKLSCLVLKECWGSPSSSPSNDSSMVDVGASSSSISSVAFHSLEYLPPAFVASILGVARRLTAAVIKAETAAASKAAKAKLASEKEEKEKEKEREKEKAKAEAAVATAAEGAQASTSAAAATASAASSANAASSTSATSTSAISSSSSSVPPPAAASATVSSASTSTSSAASSSATPSSTRPIRDGSLLSSVHESLITELISMGFSRAAAQASLLATQSTSPELNVEWLFSHAAEIEAIESEAAREASRVAQEAARVQQAIAAAESKKAASEKLAQALAEAAKTAETKIEVAKKTAWETYFGTNDMMKHVIQPLVASLSRFPSVAFHRDGLQSFPQVNQFDPHKTEPTSAMTSLVTSAATFMLTMSAATEIDIPSAFNQAFRQQMNDLMFNAIKQALEPLDAFPMPTQPNATNTVINSLTPAVVLNPCEVSMQRAHAVLQLYMMLLHEDANDQRDVDVAAFGPFLTTTLQRVFDWSQKADYVEYLNACRVSHESVKKRVELAKKSPPGDSKKQREERKEAMEEAIPPALNVMHQSFVNSLLVLSSLFLEEATLPQVTINELNGKDTKSDKKPISLPRPFAPLSSQRSLLNLSLQMLKAPLFQHDSLSYVCGVLVPLLHEKEFIDEFLSQGGLQSLVRLAGNEPPTTDDNKSKAPTVPSDFTLTPMYTLLHRLLSASSPQHHKYVIQTLLQALVCDLHRAMLRMRNQQLEEKATESLLLAGEVDAAIQSKSLQIEVIRNDHVITPSPPPAAASQHFLTPRVPFSPSLAGAIHPNNPRALQPATPLPPLVFQTPAKKGARGNNAAVVSAAQPTDHKADKGKAAKGNKKTEKKSTEEVISDSKKSGHAHKDKSKKSDSSEVASHPPLTPLSLDFHPLLHHAVLLRLLTYELDAEPHVLPYVWNFRPSQVNGVECAHTSLVSLLCQQFIIDPLQQFTSTVAICEFVLALCHYKPIKAKSSSKDKDEKKDKEEAKTAEAKESKEEKKQEKKESETASSSSSSKKSKGKQSKDKSVESSSTNNSAAAAASTSASDAASAIVPVPPAAPTALEMTRVIISEISMTLYVLICKGRPALASHLHPLHVNVPRHASAVLKAVHQHKQNSYLSMYTSDSACSSILHQKATASDAQPTATSESEPHLALRSVITSLTGLTNTLAAIMTRSTEAGASLHQHHRKIARILVDGNTHAVLCGVLAWMEFNAFSGTRLGITLVQGVTRLIETVVKLDAVFPLRASAKDSERNVRHKRHRKSKKKKRHGRGRDVVLFDDGHGGLITIDGLTGRGRRGDAPYVVHDGDELDGDGDEHDDEGDDELADAAAVNRLFAEIQAEQDAEDGLLPPNNANADDDEEVDDEALIQNAVEGEQDEEEEAAEEDEDEDDEMLMLDEDDMGSSDEDDDEDGEDDEGEDDEDDDDDDDGDDDDSDLGSIEDDDDVSESDVSDSEDEDEDEDDEVSNDEDEDGSNHSGSSDSVSEDEHSGNDNATEGDAADADAEVDADADADAADDAALDMDLLAEDEEDDLGSRSSGDSDDEDGFMDDLDAEDEIEFDGMRRGGGEDDDDGEQHVSGNIRFSQRDLSSHPLFRHLPPPPTNMRPQAAEAFRRILQGLAGTAGALDRELGSFRAAVGSNRSRETAALQSASDAAAQAIAAVERHLFSGAAGVAAESSAASTSASASASGSGAAVSTSTSSAPTSAAAATASTSSPAVPSASHSLSADEDLDETSAVDESFLAALPEELRQEILQQSSRSRRSTGNSAGSAAAVRNDEMASFQFLSYDYDTQEEILSQHPDPESFLFSLPSPAVAEILYQRHLREQGQRGSGPAAWRRMYYDYDDEGGAPEEKQQERKESESKQSEEKKKDTDADMGDDEDDSVEPKPLDAYPHVARCKELVFDRSSETHPHPLLCPSLLVPLIRVLYMSPINRATQVSAFRICDHVCVYQSTRHTLFSFVMALLRGLYTSAQTNDPMIKKMMDALPAGVMLGTKDDVTGTNLSTFSSASLSNADRAIGLPPVLSLRLFELLTHLSRRRNFGSAKFFFSPAHLTAASVELQSDDAMSESQLAHMQDLSQFSLQDAMTASPPIKPHASPLAVSKKQLKKDKKAGKKANQKESSPAFTSLGPAALQTSATSSVSPSTSPISPPPIIDLFALFGCRAVTSSRDHVKSLTYLLADIVSLPFQALDDLRTFRKGQEAKHKKRALAADSKDKLTSKTEAVGMDMDTDATASNDKKKTKSKETEDPNKKGKKAANSVSTVAATSSSSSSSSSSTFPVALLAEDDEKIWTDPTYPYPLPPCPILPSWCFSFLLSTLSIDGYPEKSLESIIRILLYFGERKKNRELIIREITTSIVTLSEGIQADMKTLVHMNATNAAPSTPNSADANNRKRKRNDAESDAMELFSFDLNTSTTSAPVETPISVSASTLMWSISQRESTLLRFVRILNTLQLIEPPRVADEDEKREENSSSPAAAASSSAASGATSPVDGKKDKDDDAAASNLTSLIKRPTINANSGMLSPASIAANKLLLVDLDFTRHMNALWSAMDSYFDIVEQRNTGFVVLLKSGGEEGKEGKETKDVKKEGKESDKPGTAKKDKTAGPSRNSSEKAAANEEAARKEAEAKAAALSKKLEDHRRDLTESDSSESSSTTRESDLLLLMHLPLIEAYFIFFAPRTQPKIHNSLSTNDRDKLPDKIAALEKSVETKQPVMDENGKPISVDSILASLNANPAAPTPAVQSASLSSFYAFTFKHRRPLNVALRQQKSLLQTSMRSLLFHPSKILDFDIRRKYFKNEIKKMVSKIKSSGHGGIKLYVRRDRIFEDSYQQLRLYKNKDDLLRSKLNIRFFGEDGLDAGGLAREWYLVLSRAIFNADNALFKPAADNPAVFQPNPESHINPDHLEFFEFAGRFVAKALMDNQRLDAYFTRSFYKHLLSVCPTYPDVESVDPEKAKSLQWMLQNSIEHIVYETFSVESVEFGAKKTVDLIPDGRNIHVTDANKALYVHLISEFILTRAIQQQLSAFLKGFHELIPAQLVSVFNEQELELMLCGLPDIDLTDLKKNIEYRGFGSDAQLHPVVKWFWEIISQFNQQEKALLVLFVTGTSKIPLEGFKALQGTTGVAKFTLQKANGVDGLPLAHTCFNTLDLGDYTSIDVMREKLMMALREGSQGFGFR